MSTIPIVSPTPSRSPLPPPLTPPRAGGEPSRREEQKTVGVGSSSVSVGHFEPMTRAMGPGLRACLWVRGCPIQCPGCATPEFIPAPRPEHAAPVAEIYDRIDRAIAEHHIEGVSFSGGEPFAQAEMLAAIAAHTRSRGLSTLAWSGWTRAHLEGPQAPAGSRDLLAQLDVLIDGPYVAALGPPQPLRGSSNQTIHLLTDRYRAEDFRRTTFEVRIEDDRMVVSGVTDYAALRATLAALGV